MTDFSRRSMTPELMDAELADFEAYRACLADLARVNIWTRTHQPTLGFLERLRRESLLPAGRPLRLLDVASGYGDLLRAVAAWAAKHDVTVDLVGLDLNPKAALAAAAATSTSAPIRWVTGDLFDYRPDEPVDVITSAQFAHHLTDDEIRRFLIWMERTATLGWFLADLHRHKLPYHFFRIWSRIMGWHRIVRIDGAISISRSLRMPEWRGLIEAAGLGGLPVELRWRVPFRITISRVNPGSATEEGPPHPPADAGPSLSPSGGEVFPQRSLSATGGEGRGEVAFLDVHAARAENA